MMGIIYSNIYIRFPWVHMCMMMGLNRRWVSPVSPWWIITHSYPPNRRLNFKAMPALTEALGALDTLSAKDIGDSVDPHRCGKKKPWLPWFPEEHLSNRMWFHGVLSNHIDDFLFFSWKFYESLSVGHVLKIWVGEDLGCTCEWYLWQWQGWF